MQTGRHSLTDWIQCICSFLPYFHLQLHAAITGNVDAEDLGLGVGSKLLQSLKQQVVTLASNKGVLKTVQSAAQGALRNGWVLLLPTPEERARALTELLIESEWLEINVESLLSMYISSVWSKIKKLHFLSDWLHNTIWFPFNIVGDKLHCMLTIVGFDMFIVLINFAPDVGMAILSFHIWNKVNLYFYRVAHSVGNRASIWPFKYKMKLKINAKFRL